MKRPARAFLLVVALVLVACAGAQSVRTETALETRFASADATRARADAPDMYARAERARARAAQAAGDEARRDDEALAELWLEAASAEAARIAEERAAARAEARYARALETRAELARQRLANEQARARAAEAEAASERARAAFGATPETQTGTPAERALARVAAARVVRERAALLLAAARGLGLAAARADELEQTLDLAARARAANTQPSSARAVLIAVESALGEVRAKHAASVAEGGALLEIARERGLAPEASAAGIVIGLDAVWSASSLELSAPGRAALAAIAELARAHPHGALRVEVASAGVDPKAQAQARARAERIAKELGKSVAKSRLELATSGTSAAGGASARVIFTGYRAPDAV